MAARYRITPAGAAKIEEDLLATTPDETEDDRRRGELLAQIQGMDSGLRRHSLLKAAVEGKYRGTGTTGFAFDRYPLLVVSFRPKPPWTADPSPRCGLAHRTRRADDAV
jgi:hypothetical protein